MLDPQTIKITELLASIEQALVELHQCAICDRALNAFVAGKAAVCELRAELSEVRR